MILSWHCVMLSRMLLLCEIRSVQEVSDFDFVFCTGLQTICQMVLPILALALTGIVGVAAGKTYAGISCSSYAIRFGKYTLSYDAGHPGPEGLRKSFKLEWRAIQ
jgi:hypothetical protein